MIEAYRVVKTEQPVNQQEGRAAEARYRHQRREGGNQHMETADPDQDQDRVRRGANQADQEDMDAFQALLEHERVLCADRENQRKTQGESEEQGVH